MSRIGKEALPFVQDNSMLWKFTLGTPGIPDASLPPADKLSKTNLTALGGGAAQLPSLGDGLGALQRMGDPPAAIQKFYKEWFTRDVNHTLANIDRIADPKVHDQVLFGNIPQIGEWDKAASVQWANAIRDEALRAKALAKAR